MESTQTRTATSDGFKLDPGHSSDCWIGDKQEFVISTERRYDLKRNGHLGGSTLFTGFRCNDPDCPAVAWVRWDRLMGFIRDGIDGNL